MTPPNVVEYSRGHIHFEWHPLKAESNRKKHGITFEEAATIFADDFGLELEDVLRSDDKRRFILLGRSVQSGILAVLYGTRFPYAQNQRQACDWRGKETI